MGEFHFGQARALPGLFHFRGRHDFVSQNFMFSRRTLAALRRPEHTCGENDSEASRRILDVVKVIFPDLVGRSPLTFSALTQHRSQKSHNGSVPPGAIFGLIPRSLNGALRGH